MSKWCRIKDGKVYEVTELDPTGRFGPSFVWQACPDNVEQHMLYDAETDNYTEFVSELTAEEIAAEEAAAIAAAEKVEKVELLFGIVPPEDNRREGATYADS